MRHFLPLLLLLGCNSKSSPEALAEAIAMEQEMLEKSGERPKQPTRPQATGLAPPLAGPITSAIPASNRLGLDLYKNLAANKPNENLFFSPASISVALTMTSAGAAGTTLEAMQSTLHLSAEQTHEGVGALMQSWNRPDQAHDLSVANRVWVQEGFPVKEPFTKILTDHYQATLGRSNFADPTANQPINQWVEDQTRQRIRDLIPPGVLDRDTRVVLVNAIYFKGTWKAQFDKEQTQPHPFTLLDGSQVKVPLMSQTGPMPLFEGSGFALIALPYEGDGVEMVAVIPSERDGLAKVEAELTEARLSEWRMSARPAPVHLSFPKLTLETNQSLMRPMSDLGMGIAMSNAADFSEISDAESLQIDEILHKAFLEVDEEGTEAAAATAVVVVTRSAGGAPQPPRRLIVDRPFLMGLRDLHTGAWLFLGRIVDPR